MTHGLEITFNLINGKTDYDCAYVNAPTRQDAIKTKTQCLNMFILRAKQGNKYTPKFYATVESFEVK